MSYKFIPAIASQSLGCPRHHSIKDKLQAAASVGLGAIEIFFEDIERLANAQKLNPNTLDHRFRFVSNDSRLQKYSKEQQLQLACASQIRQWCLEAYPGASKLEVICLQPFMHFEGLADLDERNRRIEKLYFWIEVAKHLGTTLIQIPSNFLSESECVNTRSRLVQDLRQAAEIGAAQTPPIRFAYEALCWGTHINTWDAAWSIVEEVNMPNLGTCLDTFNIAGRVFADPESQDGQNAEAINDINNSIQKLRETFSDPEKLKKVFYVELCDGERLDNPITPSHEWYNAQQPSRMTWSRNARLYPFETDPTEAASQGRNPGYLPVTQIFEALLDVGYEGYLSFEVFNRSLNQADHGAIRDHAQRVETSWRRCARFIDQYFDNKAQIEHLEDTSSSNENIDHAYLSSATVGEQLDFVNISPRL